LGGKGKGKRTVNRQVPWQRNGEKNGWGVEFVGGKNSPIGSSDQKSGEPNGHRRGRDEKTLVSECNLKTEADVIQGLGHGRAVYIRKTMLSLLSGG